MRKRWATICLLIIMATYVGVLFGIVISYTALEDPQYTSLAQCQEELTLTQAYALDLQVENSELTEYCGIREASLSPSGGTQDTDGLSPFALNERAGWNPAWGTNYENYGEVSE